MMEPSNNAVTVRNLSVTYQKKPVLWNINFTLPKGKIIGIVGPNGAGKSTLFKAMMGIIPSDHGHVTFFGKPLQQVREQVSYIPQRQSVNWHFPISVREVVMMGRYAGPLKRPKPKDHQIVATSIERVQMTPLADKQIGALSGGQQQRVFLARSLAQQAEITLMDEPFTGVDIHTETLTSELFQEETARGKILLIIHHDLAFVARYCDITLLLNLHLHAAGPTKEVLTAQHVQATYGSTSTLLSDLSHLIYKNPPHKEQS